MARLSLLARLAERGEPRLPEAAAATAVAVRKTFRARGLYIKPLPFA